VTGSEHFREITEYGVLPAPSGAGAVVIHAEEGRDCRVVLRVLQLADKAHKVAIDLAVQELATCALDRCAAASSAQTVHTIRKHTTPEEP
jgi:hypothetical protein